MFNFKKKLHSNLTCIFERNTLSNYRILIKIKPNSKSLIKRLQNSSHFKTIFSLETINLICAICNHKFLKTLTEFPEVEYICLDPEVYLCGNKTFSNTKLSNTNNLSHNIPLSGKGTSVGLIDSGIYPLTVFTNPKNRIISFIDLVNNIPYAYDDNGHGSCISSIIGGNFIRKNTYMKNSYECVFHVVKAFDKFNKSYCSTVLKALDILYKNFNENKIDVLCLPFEINEFNNFILDIFQIFFDRFSSVNTLIVIPVGNNTNEYQSLKGLSLLNNCITVGGSDLNYTSCGIHNRKIIKPTLISISEDIKVPSIDTEYISQKNNQYIYPTKIKNSFVKYFGTSCSCAYVCGLLSLLKQKNTYLNTDDAISLFKLCCDKIEDIEHSIQGLGIINANKLLT